MTKILIINGCNAGLIAPLLVIEIESMVITRVAETNQIIEIFKRPIEKISLCIDECPPIYAREPRIGKGEKARKRKEWNRSMKK